MPNHCVAANCSNKASNAVSVHLWPSNKAQADAWRRFVSTKRSHWRPSPSSYLCSAHFDEDCFVNKMRFSMGHSKRLMLRPGAVPTIHARPSPRPIGLPHPALIPTFSAASFQGSHTVTTAFSSFGVLKTTAACTLAPSTPPAQCTLAPSTASVPKTSKIRSAVRKREVSRVKTDFFQYAVQFDSHFCCIFNHEMSHLYILCIFLDYSCNYHR